MRNKLVAGNWKMHGNHNTNAELLAGIKAPFVVAEAEREIEAPEGWRSVRARRYGRTWVTFLEVV